MKDALNMMRSLHRPRLLIRAARAGTTEYRRETHLRRILGLVAPLRSGPALMRLLEIEHEINQSRLVKSAGYSVARHVEVLIAMMGEAQLMRDPF